VSGDKMCPCPLPAQAGRREVARFQSKSAELHLCPQMWRPFALAAAAARVEIGLIVLTTDLFGRL
jgi:hypothetical protein